ncbi:nitrous oxide reductase accessory protein NosL [Ottowia sp.]|uniref:nitrous oxide reductase accessory protein NosL n=1 Tax=Ottowia sp. TaxID=1898956 RepID=UPI003A8B2E4D
MKRYSCKGACCTGQTPRSADACSERRLLLGLLALSSVVPLAACSREGEGGSASTAPVEIAQDTSCELDGMLLMDYPGPKGQIHYAGAERPAFYCDTVEVLNTLLVPEQVRKVNAVYVQDMGKTDWDNPKGAWIDARTALYVQGSQRKGSMGPTFASFSAEADAQAFIQQYGGKLLRMSDITPVMVDLRGGANLDSRM